jgi:hypothetical protein
MLLLGLGLPMRPKESQVHLQVPWLPVQEKRRTS